MNSCPKKEILILYYLNLIDEKEKIQIEEHLKECIHCKREIEIENKIEKELSFEMEPGKIEDKIIKKLKVYWSLPKLSLSLRFLKVFIFSTIIIFTFLGLYYYIFNLPFNLSFISKSEEAKTLNIVLNLMIKELTSFFKTEEFQKGIYIISILFFIFNFLYAFKNYFFKDKFI